MDTILLNSIEQLGLPHWSEVYRSLGKPSIRLKTFALEGDAPIGRSRFGGEPDLPLGIKWPTFSGQSLPFVAQIRLSDAASFDKGNYLPQTGMLYFFYDIINTPSAYDLEKPSCQILFFEHETEELRRAPLPNDLTNLETLEIARLVPCGIIFSTELTFPRWIDPECIAAFYTDDPSRYEQVLRHDVEQDMLENPMPIEMLHRIGGYPDLQQPNDMLSELTMLAQGLVPYQDDVDMEELEIDRNEWVLLLQVDSDYKHSDMLWGDNGRLYLWIKREELQVRNFDHVQLLLEGL